MRSIRTTEAYALGSAQFDSLVQANSLRPGATYIIENLNQLRVATSKTEYKTLDTTADVPFPVADAVFPVGEEVALPAATGSIDFVDIEAPTELELLQFCVEINDKLNEIISVLKDAGLMDDPVI
jgi:hypothetical protein